VSAAGVLVRGLVDAPSHRPAGSDLTAGSDPATGTADETAGQAAGRPALATA
jgi:hypothetical protein